MSPRLCERIEPTHEWRQIALLADALGQRTYVLMRLVVLFDHSLAERAAVTGMAGLVPLPRVEEHRVTYQPDKRHLKTVAEERLYETPYRSPQPPLWAWGRDKWLTVLHRAEYASRKRHRSTHVQAPLFG